MLPIGGEPTDGALDATWSPAEAGFLVLSFDGGPPTPIAVPIDPTPLDALLSPGEPVRFTRTSEWSLDQRESLRLTRPDGSPLLEIQNITAYGSSADLPAFEELGVALRALPECEGLQSHSPDCAPEIRRYFAIEVGDGAVRVGPGETREIDAGDAAYARTNLRVAEWIQGSDGDCRRCAPYLPPVVQVGIVRVR